MTPACVVHTTYNTNWADKLNVCYVCGKPIGTWPTRVEAICMECIRECKTEERMEEKRNENISRPMIFYDKNDINNNRETIS